MNDLNIDDVVFDKNISGVVLSKEQYLSFKQIVTDFENLKVKVIKGAINIRFSKEYFQLGASWISALVCESNVGENKWGISAEDYGYFVSDFKNELDKISEANGIKMFFNRKHIDDYVTRSSLELAKLVSEVQFVSDELLNVRRQKQDVESQLLVKQSEVKSEQESIQKIKSLPKIIKWLFKIKI